MLPEDQIGAGDFYKTEAQFRMALAAALHSRCAICMDNDYYTAEMRSDNTHYQYYEINRGTAYTMRESIADFTDDPSNNYSNAVYFHCFKTISQGQYLSSTVLMAVLFLMQQKNDIVGQAKFLRAWNFFKLVRYFGGVPLFVHEVTDANRHFFHAGSVEEVYTQIIDDARDAINKTG